MGQPAASAVRQRPAIPAEMLRAIREVEIKARILADEGFLGAYRSVFRGSGLEFEEVREYQPGDDVRSIDWNVAARMGLPYVKKYREERELSVTLAVDVSASSWFGTAALSKRELAANVGALLSVAALRTNDRVGLLLFADRVLEYHPPRRSHDHLLRIIRALLCTEQRRSSTRIGVAADFLRNVGKKRGVVFVISDFLDEGFEAPLRMLGRKHDLVALTLNDPRELDLPAVGVVELEDAESGTVRAIDTGSSALRESYGAAMRRRRVERLRVFARMAVDCVDLSTDRPYLPPLIQLFATRTRRH